MDVGLHIELLRQQEECRFASLQRSGHKNVGNRRDSAATNVEDSKPAKQYIPGEAACPMPRHEYEKALRFEEPPCWDESLGPIESNILPPGMGKWYFADMTLYQKVFIVGGSLLAIATLVLILAIAPMLIINAIGTL